MSTQDCTLSGYLMYWGKARPCEGGGKSWHPVAYHCLDVAAVADVLLRTNHRKLGAIAGLLGTSPNNARATIVALIALHDIGKFSAAFQAKSEANWPAAGVWPTQLLGKQAGNNTRARHDLIGSELRDKLELKALFGDAFSGWSNKAFDAVWHSVSGHHGQPAVGLANPFPAGMNSHSVAAATAFCSDVACLLGPFHNMPAPHEPQRAALSWTIAGLTVISDWIGSNRASFPYTPPTLPLADYWPVAQTLAEIAVRTAGIDAIPSAGLDAKALFPGIDVFSPLQRHVADMPLPDGPMLAIIEDVTGSGKTEAAILLAARLMAAGRADGLFFALPTMATANAMFERMGDAYRRIFDAGAVPSLVLAHGKRHLNEGFTASLLASTASSHESSAEAAGDQSSASCSAWIADDRRKAFLAHVGVGTIDQAILGVLPSRHQSLRLWGLSDRVLVIDEAHAYDAYMSREIETLLEFQAALGGSALVLSATLPAKQRQALAAAFAWGLGREKCEAADDASYPLLTITWSAGTTGEPLASRTDRARTLEVTRLPTAAQAVDHIVAVAERGAAVAWIRNAVDDAIEAVHLLQARELDPVLLHARFAMGDRLDIEERVRTTLGPKGTAEQRVGLVLVGTQILEQSLDYDVDAMVTDLAPVDLMIQRAGRLWRHSTRSGRPITTPTLMVVAPDPAAAVGDKDWYRAMSKRAAAVYGHHGIVWRSAKALFDAGHIATPGGVRGLVEAVYGPASWDDVPEALHAQSKKAEGEMGAARSFANANLLKLGESYAGAGNIWTPDTVTPTRLGQEVTVFRLGRIEDGVIVPYYAPSHSDASLMRRWALSEVSLNRNKAKGVPPPDKATAALIERALASWSPWEREQPLLLLTATGDGWTGRIIDAADKAQAVHYDKRTGLRITAA